MDGRRLRFVRAHHEERRLVAALLLLALLLTIARFVHLDADFPSGLTNSRAPYTDEGLYAINAVAAGRGESWYVPGELNTMVSFPIVPLLQGAVFRQFGPGLAAARSLVAAAAVVLIAGAAVIALETSAVSAALVAVLLSADFLLFGYSRLATYDTIATALTVLALVPACRWLPRQPWLTSGLAGALLGVAMLAKTTAVCALPALLYLCASQPGGWRRKSTLAAMAGGACGVVSIGYHACARYLWPLDNLHFGAMPVTRPASGLLELTQNLAVGLTHIVRYEQIVAPVVLVAGTLLIWRSEAFRRNRTVHAAGLWLGGFLAMLSVTAYQPSRYFVMVLPPLFLLLGAILVHAGDVLHSRRVAIAASVSLVGGLLAVNGSRIAMYLWQPNYSFLTMAQEVAAIVEAPAPDGRPGVLMGDMAESIALAAGIRGIDSSQARWGLAVQTAAHCPTYYITLGKPEGREFQELSQFYRVPAVREWNVFGNYYGHETVRLFSLEPRGTQPGGCASRVADYYGQRRTPDGSLPRAASPISASNVGRSNGAASLRVTSRICSKASARSPGLAACNSGRHRSSSDAAG